MVEDDDVGLCQALLLKGDIDRSAVGVDLFEITNLKVRLCLEDIKDNLPSVAGVVIRVRIDNEDFHWGKYLDALRLQRIEIIRGGGLLFIASARPNSSRADSQGNRPDLILYVARRSRYSVAT